MSIHGFASGGGGGFCFGLVSLLLLCFVGSLNVKNVKYLFFFFRTDFLWFCYLLGFNCFYVFIILQDTVNTSSSFSPEKKTQKGKKWQVWKHWGGKKKKRWFDQLKITHSIQKHVFKQYEKIIHFNIFYKCIKYTQM